jgi:hypothetical protein
MCQMYFKCTILVQKCMNYEWMNRFCTIFITKLWDAKFFYEPPIGSYVTPLTFMSFYVFF